MPPPFRKPPVAVPSWVLAILRDWQDPHVAPAMTRAVTSRMVSGRDLFILRRELISCLRDCVLTEQRPRLYAALGWVAEQQEN